MNAQKQPRPKLAQFLRDTRTSAHMSQRKLAKRLQRAHSYVAKVELGKRRLPVDEFVVYAHALGADPIRLLEAFITPPPSAMSADGGLSATNDV